MTLDEAWECPVCHTLNTAETRCYSCGAARPSSAAGDATSVDAQPADTQPAEADLEPHPCWCNLVKGPHDTRDHPGSADRGSADSPGESPADLEADSHLKQLELDLGSLTHDWTDLTVERAYDSGDDGEQDYEDEAMLFEQHGYTKWVDRPQHAIKATYTIGDGLPAQQ